MTSKRCIHQNEFQMQTWHELDYMNIAVVCVCACGVFTTSHFFHWVSVSSLESSHTKLSICLCMASPELHDLKFSPVMWNFWCMQTQGPSTAIWLNDETLRGTNAIDGIWFTWNCRIMIAQAPKVACTICSLRKWCMQICGPKDMQSDWLISRCAIWSDWLMCKLIWLTDAQSDLIDCCAIWLMDVQYDKNLENPKEIL